MRKLTLLVTAACLAIPSVLASGGPNVQGYSEGASSSGGSNNNNNNTSEAQEKQVCLLFIDDLLKGVREDYQESQKTTDPSAHAFNEELIFNILFAKKIFIRTYGQSSLQGVTLGQGKVRKSNQEKCAQRLQKLADSLTGFEYVAIKQAVRYLAPAPSRLDSKDFTALPIEQQARRIREVDSEKISEIDRTIRQKAYDYAVNTLHLNVTHASFGLAGEPWNPAPHTFKTKLEKLKIKISEKEEKIEELRRQIEQATQDLKKEANSEQAAQIQKRIDQAQGEIQSLEQEKQALTPEENKQEAIQKRVKAKNDQAKRDLLAQSQLTKK